MSLASTYLLRACPLPFVAALLLVGCGDDLVTSASDSATDGSSTGDTSTTTTGASASATATDTASSGESDSATTSTSTSSTSSTSESTGVSSTTGDTDTSTSGDTDTSTSGDTSTSTTGDTSTSTTGDPLTCVDAGLPYAGALCGDAEAPCEVVVDEAVEADHHFRNEAPAVAFDNDCAPQVLYSIAEGGYHGYFAVREGVDQWAIEKTPFPIARVGLDYDHDADETLALTYDGAFGTSLWSKGAGPWAEIEAPAGKQIASAHGFARDPASGAAHAAVVTDGYAARHAIYDGGWTTDDLGTQASTSATLALDGDGGAHLAFWSSVELTWKLYYANPPEPAEEILALGSNVLNIQRHGVAAFPGDNDPLAVGAAAIAATQQPGGLHDLVLAQRIAPGKWTTEVIVSEDDQDAKLCAQPPAKTGDLCDYDYIRYIPLGIVASDGGDVRFFFRQTHYVGTLIGECVMMPFPICTWHPNTNDNTAELRIGWPTEQGPKWATITDEAFITDMSARIDAEGRIHVAAYDTENGDNFSVRYLRIE